MKAPLWLGTSLAVLLAATPARSQQESVAESLFRQAREDMKRGDAVDACPKFEESYRLDPSIGALLNLAFCEEALGHTATAWSKLRQFLESAPAADDRVPVAREKLAELEAELPRLHLVIDQGNDQTTVLLDGVELRGAGLNHAVAVDPGEHVVRISGSSGEFNETSFRIDRAEELDLHISPPPLRTQPVPTAVFAPLMVLSERPTPSAAVSASTGPDPSAAVGASAGPIPSHRSTERAAAYGLGVVGVAGLVTSAVSGLMAFHDRNFVHDQCPNRECQSLAGQQAAESGRRNTATANVAFGVGAIGLVTGGILLWHSGRAKAAASVNSNRAFFSVEGVIR